MTQPCIRFQVLGKGCCLKESHVVLWPCALALRILEMIQCHNSKMMLFESICSRSVDPYTNDSVICPGFKCSLGLGLGQRCGPSGGEVF